MNTEDIWNEVLLHLYEKHHQASRLAFPEERAVLMTSLEHDTYEFKPPRLQEIPKDDGTMRKILIMDFEDNIVMNFLYRLYRQKAKIDPHAVAYQQGLSVASIVHRLAPKALTKYDIHAYFDTVPIELIDKALDELEVYPAVKRFFHDNRVNIKGELVEYYKGICQGCPMSALLANMCLRDVDQILATQATTYIRYSDDILTDAPETLVRSAIGDAGFTLSEHKVSKVYDDYDFLGAHIKNGQCGISTRGKKKLRATVRTTVHKLYKNKNPQAYLNKAVRRVFTVLSGDTHSSLSYWRQICTTPEDFKWLDKIIRNTIAQHYTGKANVTHNNHVFTKSMWEKAWMPDFIWLYDLHPIAMKSYVYYLCKNGQKTIKTTQQSEDTSSLATLWEEAKKAPRPMFYTDYERTTNKPEHYDTQALRETLQRVHIDFEGKPYKVFGSLILFEKWFEMLDYSK